VLQAACELIGNEALATLLTGGTRVAPGVLPRSRLARTWSLVPVYYDAIVRPVVKPLPARVDWKTMAAHAIARYNRFRESDSARATSARRNSLVR
jgi:hypothetical protein